MLDGLGIAGKKTLHVLGESNKNVYLSARNIEKSQVIINSELSTYGISNATYLVLSESSIASIESILNR